MIYEVLKAKGVPGEATAEVGGRVRNWRQPQDKSSFIIKYRSPEERPKQYAGHEVLFKGNPYEMMDWLHPRQVAWGVTIEKKVMELPRAAVSTAVKWGKRVAWAVAASGVAAGLYHYIG